MEQSALKATDSNSAWSRETLFGRDDQLARLDGFLARAAGDGEALIVLGEPGVGKTALLNAAEAMAAGLGGRVLSAAGVESEADITFAGLHELLFPLHDEISELTDSYREALEVALGFGDGPPPDRLRVANAALTLLVSVAQSAPPLLVILDDLQWLDRSSAVVLSMVARRLRGTRVAMLGALRSGEESFFERSGLATEELGPLENEAADALLQARFPGLSPMVRDRLLDESEGNPLAVLEFPAALSDRQRTGPGALPTVLPLPRRLQEVFRSRAASLPDRTKRLLLAIALDDTGDVRLLGLTESGLDDLAPAEEAGVASIDQVARRVVFRHPLMRSAVVELSTVADRRAAHQKLAEAWSDERDRQVRHLAEATVHPDEGVAALLEEASARVMRRGDGVGAVDALIRAAALSPTASQRARRTALAAYIGADVSGHLEDASRLLADAHNLDPAVSGSLQAATTAALLLLNGEGNVETAHRLLVGAIAEREPGGDEPAVVWEAFNTLLMVCHYGGRPELYEAFDREFDGLKADAPQVLRLSAQILADPARDAAPVLPELDAIIARLATEQDPAHIIRTAIPCFYVDRLSAFRKPLARLVQESSARGLETLAIYALCTLGYDSFVSGEWGVCLQQADQAAELCRVNGFHLTGAWPSKYCQAVVAAGRGESEMVRAIADEMIQWAVPRGIRSVQWYAWHAQALLALGSGDFDEAFECASRISAAGTFASHVYFALWAMMDLVEAAVRSGRDAEASAHVAAMRDLDLAGLGPRSELLVAGSSAMSSPFDEGFEQFEQALRIPDSDRWPFDRARIELAYGERLRRAGAVTDARSHLALALNAFERLGARPWIERAATEMRATGQTRVRGLPGSNGVLTPQELEIATLAATGLSNKEIGQRMFLSPRTVAAHLYRVFPKLGVSSRAGLRDALGSLPSEQTPK